MADAAGAPSDDGMPAWNEAVRSPGAGLMLESGRCVGQTLGRLAIGHAARCLPMRQGAQGDDYSGDCWSAGDGWPQRARHMTSPGGATSAAWSPRATQGRGGCPQAASSERAKTTMQRQVVGAERAVLEPWMHYRLLSVWAPRDVWRGQ